MAPIDFLTKLKNTYFGHEGECMARLAEADRIPRRLVSLKLVLLHPPAMAMVFSLGRAMATFSEYLHIDMANGMTKQTRTSLSFQPLQRPSCR
jgi:hypothetical protein